MPLFWKYNEARKIFLDAPQAAPAELTWTEPDEEALVEFLCRTTRVRCVLTPVHSICFFLFFFGGFFQLPAGLRRLCLCSWFICSEGRVRQRLVKFHQTRESKREEREQQHAAGRQTHMEDFFRITRKRSRVSNSLFY